MALLYTNVVGELHTLSCTSFPQVNGYDVTNVTHEEAAGLLQNSGTKVILQVYREPSETLL